jgi:Kef-type K+ transport system membrane component KefB
VEPLPGISHEDLLKIVVTIAALLLAARLFGELSQRIGQPAVVGEILAGVVLGPSVLSGLFPGVAAWIVPATAEQAHLLDLIGLIGVMFLLIVTGLETDIGLIRSRAGTALGVAVGGLLVPFAAGAALGVFFPSDLLVAEDERIVFTLFIATALAISAIPVLAKVLMDLDLLRLELGQTLLAAGMVDDITGWAMLGIVTALAAAGSVTPMTFITTGGAVALFVLLTLLVAVPVARRALALVQDHATIRFRLVSLVVVFAFAWGAFSHALHLEPVVGAFAVGIIFGQMRRLPPNVGHELESITFGVLAPIFLATAGLRIDLAVLRDPRLLALTLAVVAVATAGKVIGAYAGARLLARRGHWEAVAYGAGLNARGVLEIIIATIGLSMGILGREVYSMIVIMAVVTSIMAPAGLRLAVARLPEVSVRRRPGSGVRRVLVPVRPRSDRASLVSDLGAEIVARVAGAGPPPAVTVMSVATEVERADAAELVAHVATLIPRRHEVATKVIVDDEPVTRILEECARDYDMMLIGASERVADSPFLFNPVVDDLVRLAPCTTLVVRPGVAPMRWPPRRILVPVDGKSGSRRAAEVAMALSDLESELVVLNVVAGGRDARLKTAHPAMRFEIGREIVDEVRVGGEELGLGVVTEVVMGDDAVAAILDVAADVDLLVLGTSVRPASARLFLGPKVEHILRHAPCPVIVVNEV